MVLAKKIFNGLPVGGMVLPFKFWPARRVCIGGGQYLNKFSTPSMGVAGAGTDAVAVDTSTSLHNSAGMKRLKGNELMAKRGLPYATVEFDPDDDTPIPGGDGGNAKINNDLLKGDYNAATSFFSP